MDFATDPHLRTRGPYPPPPAGEVPKTEFDEQFEYNKLREEWLREAGFRIL